MNLVGKILTVLILVVSVLLAGFLVAVYTTTRNWRAIVETPQNQVTGNRPLGLKYQLENANQQVAQLNTQKSDLQKALVEEKAASDKTRAQLESAVADLRTDLAGLTAQKEALDKQLSQTVAELSTSSEDLGRLRDEVNVLRTEIRNAQADRELHSKHVTQMTEEAHELNNELATLKSLNTTLAQDFAKAQEVLRHFGLNKDMDISGTPPPVDGEILATPDKDIVEISIGSDDGLQIGHRLEVFRISGGTSVYVARIEVVKALPDRAVCRIVPGFQKSAVMRGDRVTSKL